MPPGSNKIKEENKIITTKNETNNGILNCGTGTRSLDSLLWAGVSGRSGLADWESPCGPARWSYFQTWIIVIEGNFEHSFGGQAHRSGEYSG